VDPLVEETMDAYGYCYQNPILLTDPTGMSPEGGGDDNKPPKKSYDLDEVVVTGKQKAVLKPADNTRVHQSRIQDLKEPEPIKFSIELSYEQKMKRTGALVDPSFDIFTSWAGGKAISSLFNYVGKGLSALFVTQATKLATVEVTEASVLKAIQGSGMQTLQDKVSLPMIERYVRMLEKGMVAPPIKVSNGIIIEGNHRYIAGRLFGKLPEQVKGTISPSQSSLVKLITNMKVDRIDWGGK
jgi:hypothetical protein